MIPVQGFEGRRVGVLGLARTGLGAARALAAGGAVVVGWDDSPKARAEAEVQGISVVDLSHPAAREGLSLLVVSPGIPHLYPKPHPVVAAALAEGIPLDNDVGLFFRSLGAEHWSRFERPPRVIAVTGTNGKSTTTALIAHLLAEAGWPVQTAGNIGQSVLALDPPGEGAAVVLELSSYQLELARALTPDVAVFLNLTPDHLDRHGGLGGYFAAKRRLFAEGGPDHCVIGVDEPEGQFLATQLSLAPEDRRVIRIAVTQKLDRFGWAVFARRGFLAEWRQGRQVASLDLRGLAGLPGVHNHQNACAAWAACRALGVPPRALEKGLMSFRGLAHRCEQVAEVAGVRFVNDSKATNAEAALQALRAFPRIRWIAGGRAKDGGIVALTPVLGSVVKAYLIGEAAELFARQIGATPFEICHTLEAAVARAFAEAAPGEVVLLSPAAASFDQYSDFEARGNHFRALVAALKAKAHPKAEAS